MQTEITVMMIVPDSSTPSCDVYIGCVSERALLQLRAIMRTHAPGDYLDGSHDVMH